ncbi:hypothetical protein ABT124_35300 [Streptomyces sp. NPDC001982]|uniref:hypothetical protein n=1 Tax=Streptomyces sp. NPDC001982 TaxID=3154405 RepID=UPI0033284D5F
MLSDYQQELRDRFLSVPEVPAPLPWQRVWQNRNPIGGLIGIGFAADPQSGRDLVLVNSFGGLGLFDAVTGEKIARDRDPDPDSIMSDLLQPGIGPVSGSQVFTAGLYGGGLHTVTDDGWSLEVVSPEWPNDRVLLSTDGGIPHSGPHGEKWWHVFHSHYSELRAVGFSPTGRTLAVATSSDLTLWTRETPAA